MFSKILAAGLVVFSLLGMGSACDDPGDPNSAAGKPHKGKPVALVNGSVISAKSYGMYRAQTGGPYASPANCRWTVTMHGKIAASGGLHDAIIAGHGLRGGVVHLYHCDRFFKD